MVRKIWNKIKHHFLEVLKIKRSPHSIALGFSIGTLVEILPTPGFNILIALLVVMIYEKINKLSLFGAIIVWNPLVKTPFYILSFKIGDMIFGSVNVVKYNIIIIDQAYNFSRRFLVGNFILAVIMSITSYLVVRIIVTIYQKKILGTIYED